MDLGLKKEVAVVTGSSRGSGRAIAHKLAEGGCHVSLCARTIGPLEACESVHYIACYICYCILISSGARKR